MTWTQPLCIPCWNRDNPDRQTQGRRDVGDLERCCKCGSETRCGRYILLDPKTVPYPREAAKTFRSHLETWQFTTALRCAEVDPNISDNELTSLRALSDAFGNVGPFEGVLAGVVNTAVAKLFDGWPD